MWQELHFFILINDSIGGGGSGRQRWSRVQERFLTQKFWYSAFCGRRHISFNWSTYLLPFLSRNLPHLPIYWNAKLMSTNNVRPTNNEIQILWFLDGSLVTQVTHKNRISLPLGSIVRYKNNLTMIPTINRNFDILIIHSWFFFTRMGQLSLKNSSELYLSRREETSMRNFIVSRHWQYITQTQSLPFLRPQFYLSNYKWLTRVYAVRLIIVLGFYLNC